MILNLLINIYFAIKKRFLAELMDTGRKEMRDAKGNNELALSIDPHAA